MLPRQKVSSKISCQENSRVSFKQFIIFESTYMFFNEESKVKYSVGTYEVLPRFEPMSFDTKTKDRQKG